MIRYSRDPLNLDGYFFDERWQSGWKPQVQARLAADFTGWESKNATFEAQVERVVDALKTERPKPPQSRL